MNNYRILDGEFVQGSRTLSTGDSIQLEADIAALHKARLQLLGEVEIAAATELHEAVPAEAAHQVDADHGDQAQ